MSDTVLGQRPQWLRTGADFFPAAARVDGQWWVLRINGFPDHPLWTLFIDGNTTRFDIDDLPSHWDSPLDPSVPLLHSDAARKALAPVRDLAVYGSEVGEPCDDPVCCGNRFV